MIENLTFAHLGSLTKVRLSITNVGHTPATLVVSDARLILDDSHLHADDDYFAFEEKSNALREKMCEDLFLNFTLTEYGATLFPGQEVLDDVNIGLNEEQLEHEKKSGHTVLFPMLITCSSYRSSFNDHRYWVSNMYGLGEIISGEFYGITPQKELKPAQMAAISQGHMRRAFNGLILGRVVVLAEVLEDLHEK
jgi:hypothetical protein